MKNRKRKTDPRPIEIISKLLIKNSPEEDRNLLEKLLSGTKMVKNQNLRCLAFLAIINAAILKVGLTRHDGLYKLIEQASLANISAAGDYFSRSLDYTNRYGAGLVFLVHQLAQKSGISNEEWQELLNQAAKYSKDTSEIAILERMFDRPAKPENGKEPGK